MKTSLRFLGATLFVLSMSLDASAQHAKSTMEKSLVTTASPTPEYSTWLLLAAGALGVVVARKRV